MLWCRHKSFECAFLVVLVLSLCVIVWGSGLSLEIGVCAASPVVGMCVLLRPSMRSMVAVACWFSQCYKGRSSLVVGVLSGSLCAMWFFTTRYTGAWYFIVVCVGSRTHV